MLKKCIISCFSACYYPGAGPGEGFHDTDLSKLSDSFMYRHSACAIHLCELPFRRQHFPGTVFSCHYLRSDVVEYLVFEFQLSHAQSIAVFGMEENT